jgi:ligand-binding sensor domain-containing protein
MNKYCLYIFLLAIIFSANAQAQFSKTRLYTIESDELEKLKIVSLYQQDDGLILCGTTKGLYRFDGFDFTLYPYQKQINAAVTAIFQTKDKRILLGFSNGNIAELKNNIISLLHFDEGFPKVAINSIIQDTNGIVWLGTAGEGVYYIRNNRLYNINEDDGLSDNYIYKLIYFPQHGIVATSDRGINFCAVNNGKKYISTYTSKNGLPDNIVRAAFLNGNYLWLGMQDAGIFQYTANAGNTTLPKWKYGQVNDVLVTSAKIFAATEDSGLVVLNYDKGTPHFTVAYSNNAIPKSNCLLKDREGNIWVAGENELLKIGNDHLQQVYKLSKSEAAQIHCLHYTTDSALWFNTSGGITRLYKQNNDWKAENFKLPFSSNTTITALYKDPARNLWVGSLGNGITVFNYEKRTQYKLNDSLLATNNTISITGDENYIWISGLEGVVRAQLNNGKYTFTNFTDTAGIGNKYVYDILCDRKKRVWFATDGDGISVLNSSNKFFHLADRKDYVGNVVYKIIQDNYGNIWYATYDKGVIKYNGEKFTVFTTDEGLSDITITGLLNAGNYIAVIHKNSIDIINPLTGKITYIDRALITLDINTDLNACTSDKAGNIYFISGNNIYSYYVDETSIQQPSINIDKVELFLKDIPRQNNQTFSHNENNLSFFFTGIYYSEPEKIQYQYKLEGYDKDWVNTKDRVKNFPNLGPGTYTFRVRVSLNNNFNDAPEASFSFVIQKPFWLQAWFIIAVILFVGLVFYLYIKSREKRINDINTLKNQKIHSQLETLRSQINPHFLFNSLNTLVSEIENNQEEAVTYVEIIADFYRSIIQHREKDIIPLADELHILRDYVFLQEKRFGCGLEVKVNINPSVISSSYIPPLVLQLLVENATKHNIIAKETPLRIEIKDIAGDCLTVTNNINKKIQPERRSGLGLQNIQKRYELLLRKKVIIESDEKFFTVKIPLIKK